MRLAGQALSIGVFAAGAELWLRNPGPLGLDTAEWLVLGSLGTVMTAVVCLVGKGVEKGLDFLRLPLPPDGLALGLPVALHGAIWVRFGWLATWPATEPKLLAALAGIVGLAMLAGILAGRWLAERSGAVALCGGLLFCAAVLNAARDGLPEVFPDAPNVVFITLDTVRMDSLGAYGGPSTPNLDALAQEGVVFEQAIATAPLTQASHLAMMTGVPPFVSGVVSNGTYLGRYPGLVQHAFGAAGFETAGFVSGFPLHHRFGWDQGFRYFDDDFGRYRGLRMLGFILAADAVLLPGGGFRERIGARTVAQFERFLKRHDDRPFFAWIHLFDAHAPYEVDFPTLNRAPRNGPPLPLPKYWPRPYRSITSVEWLLESYAREIARVDADVGTVMRALESKGVAQNTVVVVVADHGESMTEHDSYFDHGQHLYDASLRVPLIVRAPGVAQPGLRVPCQLSTVDVAPSLLELGQVEALEPKSPYAHSFVSLMQGEDCVDREVLSSTVRTRFVESPPVDHSTRMPDTKLIRHQQGWFERYDLANDPGETNNLVTSSPEELEALRVYFEERLEGAGVPIEMGDDVANIEAMRALGYVE
ncbi:MAG: sulfatase [Myxococcota bacterium]|nr:sulfatase [Myxococcota bacterium]